VTRETDLRQPRDFDYGERLERDYQREADYWQAEDRKDRHAPAPTFTVGLARTRLRESITVLFSLALQSEISGRQETWDKEATGFE
jgi:hypothetical protein